MKEIWKKYKVYEGRGIGHCSTDIEISNHGNVRGDEQSKWNNKPFSEEMITLKQGRRCIGGTRIYTLVWYAFRGELPKGYVVHHKDFDKLNDSLDNLERMTRSEHMHIHSSLENHGGLEAGLFGWFNNGVDNIFIKLDDTIPNGYVKGRLLKGNMLKYERTNEIKAKISEKHKGTHLTEETKRKISEAVSGENNPFYGKKHSEAAKQKISRANRGKILGHWYNNGIIEIRSETPPNGFVPGRLKRNN